MSFSPMPAQLRTERLVLSPWTEVDVATYRALVAERGAGTPPIADVTERLQRQRAVFAEHGLRLYALTRLRQRDVIGYCGLVVGRSTPEEPELAYELFRRAHRSGYATEAARAVVAAAAATGRLRLWATIRPDNAPSLRVVDKLGCGRDHTSTDERGAVIWYRLDLAR